MQVELLKHFGSDRCIAEAAWTSSLDYQKKKRRTEEDVARVVNLLADSKHSVPFEYIVLRFWLRLPIAIDRQVQTHRLTSASGLSARYRTMPSDFLDMDSGVADILHKTLPDNFEGTQAVQEYDHLQQRAHSWYQRVVGKLKEAEKSNLITNGELKRAREFIRGVLPQHSMTERVIQINLRSFANFIKLRSKLDAQPEIRYIATEMLRLVKESDVCPIAIAALERNNWQI